MLIICGKSASGKDTIKRELISKHGFKGIVTYTTRPPRKGEQDGVDYHFVSNEEFQMMVNSGFFLEWKEYDTVNGTWYYGSALNDYDGATKNTVVILTPSGYLDFLNRSGNSENHLCIYLYANLATIRKRLKSRGDNKEEAERRISKDNEDFREFSNIAHKIVYNNDGAKTKDVVEKILSDKYWEE